MSEELKPCPFCGHAEIDPAEWTNRDGITGPACPKCNAMADSVEAWNRRAFPTRDAEGKPLYYLGGGMKMEPVFDDAAPQPAPHPVAGYIRQADIDALKDQRIRGKGVFLSSEPADAFVPIYTAPQPAPATGDASSKQNEQPAVCPYHTHQKCSCKVACDISGNFLPATGDEREALFAIAAQFGWTRKGDQGQWIVCHTNASENLVKLAAALQSAHPSQPIDMVSSGGETTDEQILQALEHAGVKFQSMYSYRLRADNVTTAGSVDASKIVAAVKALLQASAAHRREDQRDTYRAQVEALIDIYDDAQNNPPEHRCYVEGAFTTQMNHIRSLLQFDAAMQRTAAPAQTDTEE